MNNKLAGIFSLLVAVLFILGFIGLFMINPQTYDEINNLCISGYNIKGMKGYIWITVFYIITGLLMTIVAIRLLKMSDNKSIIVVGKILLIISGVLWTTFGLTAYFPSKEPGLESVIIRTIVFTVTSSFGLLLIGIDIERIIKKRFLKLYTLATAGIIILLNFLSLFVFEEHTWIRTNLCLVIYFVWFGVFGIEVIRMSINRSNIGL